MMKTSRFAIFLLCMSLPLVAAAQSTHLVTTSGGVQRLATVVDDRAPTNLTIRRPMPQQAPAYVAPRATDTASHRVPPRYVQVARQPSAPVQVASQRQYAPAQQNNPASRVARIPGNVTNNALTTATRTAEQQLNWQINSAIRNGIRNVIQF